MVKSTASQPSAVSRQKIEKESLLDEVIESASKLAIKLFKLLINTQCLSSAEKESGESAYTKNVLLDIGNLANKVAGALDGDIIESREPAYTKQASSEVDTLVQDVAGALPGNIKNGANVPVGNADSLEQVKLPLFCGEIPATPK